MFLFLSFRKQSLYFHEVSGKVCVDSTSADLACWISLVYCLLLLWFACYLNKLTVDRYHELVHMLLTGNETFEKLGAIGTLSNLLIYLTSVFNLKHISAVTLINVFNGTTNFATLIGAFLSDTYFGRYKTLGFSSITSFLVVLVIPILEILQWMNSMLNYWFRSFLFEGVVCYSINSSIQEPTSSSLRLQRYQPMHRTNWMANGVFVEWIWATDHRSSWD